MNFVLNQNLLTILLTAIQMINFVPHCTCQTPVPSNSSIQTSPTSFQIIPIPLKYGDPCVYKAYEKFVAETQIKNISHVLNFVYYENSLPYFSYLSDICIEVSDDLVIDAHKFDCVKQGDKEVCTCGYNMYKVDPLLSPSIIIESGHQYRTYRAVVSVGSFVPIYLSMNETDDKPFLI